MSISFFKLDPLTRANALKLTSALSPNISDGREGGTTLVFGGWGMLRGKGEGLYLNSQSALIQFVNSQPTPVLMKSPPSRGLYIFCVFITLMELD